MPYREGTYNARVSAYSIYIAAAYTIFADDGDLVEDLYGLNTYDEDDFLEITHIDTLRGELTGRFAANFAYGDPDVFPKVNPDNPDAVRFENGVFKVRLEN